MKLYLISNNLLNEQIAYDNTANLDTIRMIRPLSIYGETIAKNIACNKIFTNTTKIYSSNYSSSIETARYLADKLDLKINIREELNECKVGILGSKNMKMVKGLQDHEFTYKLPNGESLIDVGNRIDNFIKNIKDEEDIAIFTHKRAIVGFLLKHTEVGYNLDDYLILSFNNEVVYDDTETEIDIYEIELIDNKVENIKKLSEIS